MSTGVAVPFASAYRWLRRGKNRLLNRLDPPLLLLAYHRVADLADDPHQLAVSPENFRAQMEYLRDHCHCLRGEGDWGIRRGPALVVTFDDGYADNLHQALPILEETGIPATFFISTGQLDSCAEFWSDELERVLLRTAALPEIFVLADFVAGGRWPTRTPSEREALHRQLHRRMLRCEPDRRAAWLQDLRAWAGVSPDARSGYRPLTRVELQQLAASPLVTIGAHGVSHTPLSVLPAAEQAHELQASKAELEGLLDREVMLFSYPFGGYGDYNASTRSLCRAAGYRRAVTTFPGQVHRWSDPWQLPRQLVRNWDAPAFAARLESFWTR